MKNTTKPTILAINPGTRYIGIAVLEGSSLIDWGVKVFEGRWSPAKLTKIAAMVSALIAEYRPSIVVIKRLHPARTSVRLNVLWHEVEALADKRSIEVRSYSIQEIEAYYTRDARTNKMTLVEAISTDYPALAPLLRKEQQSGNPYHIRMFEAVALGMCAHSAKSNAFPPS